MMPNYPCPNCGKARTDIEARCQNCDWSLNSNSPARKITATSKPMNGVCALILGLLSVIPFFYVGVMLRVAWQVMNDDFKIDERIFNSFFLIHASIAILIIIETAFYSTYIYKSSFIPEKTKLRLVLFTFFMGFLAYPFIWYFYVWMHAFRGMKRQINLV